MPEFAPRQLLLAGIAVVAGLVLGGLGPRAELRAVREQLAQAESQACERNVGSEIASVFRGRPWEPPREEGVAVPEPEVADPPQEPPTTGVQVTVDDDDDDGPNETEMDAMRDAMELRRTQAVAALREQAGASDAQMATVESITNSMNEDLHGLATEFVESVSASGGEPSRHEMMVFAADTLDVLLSAEEQLYGTLDEDQRAAVDEEATDPLSFVDGRVVEVLAELESVRDALLVARFEVLRAVRTWRALALLVLYGVAAAGAAWMFAEFVGMLENTVADQLGVARTETPGAMLDTLVASDTWREFVTGLVGSEHLVDHVLRVPPLAFFDLWFSFLIVPFFAASAAAECLAIDVGSRAIRFEAGRTGRLELVFGRFLGQAALTAFATFGAALVMWVTGWATMVLQHPLVLLGWLVVFVPRSIAFALPFVGLGVAASQLTASPAWARVLAVGSTAATWVAYAVARNYEGTWWAPLCDAVLQVLPQGWLRGLWEPGSGWAGSALALVALTLAVLSAGYVRFAGRDL